jgi:hypothetical protein
MLVEIAVFDLSFFPRIQLLQSSSVYKLMKLNHEGNDFISIEDLLH